MNAHHGWCSVLQHSSTAAFRTRLLPALLSACLVPLSVAHAAGTTPTGDPHAHDALVPYLRADRIVMPSSAAWRALRTPPIPSYSRQTKLACSVCHYGFPQLTPFGRLFKLNGYTLTGLTTIEARDSARATLELAPIPPAAAMVVISLTQLASKVPGTQNATTAFPDQASLFLAGEITPKLGAFTQFTYTAADASFSIDNVDLRFANHTTLGSHDLIYGVTLHNNPTVQDAWNTVPAWGFPFMSSGVAPTPAASVLIDGALGQQVLGLGAYGFWNQLIYAEFTAYRSAPQGAPAPLGAEATGTIHQIAPYWRVALQHQFGTTYAMVGTYGLAAHLYPTGITGLTDNFTDLAADAQVEHRLGTAGVLIGRTTYIHERQSLDALVAQDTAGAANLHNTLHALHVNASYMPDTRLNATLGYFDTWGTHDAILYAPATVTGSATGSPNSDGEIAELDFNAWQNVRLGAQYVVYNRFNGGRTAYDGSGRNASNNDTLYLYTWLAF